jgi:dephospho-CoA kinase
MRSRGLDRAAADAMIASQMPSEAKRSQSTYLIDNTGDLEALERRARQVWESLQEYQERE